MLLVDTSVVFDYTRSADPAMLAIFQAEYATITGIIRAEVLHGTRDPRPRARLIAALDSFRQENIPPALWDQVGDYLAALRAQGISVPFNDVAIAALAIQLGVELWTRDQQFSLIQSVLSGLRLYRPGP
ncbi:MAG: PIN domain-containing protein [Pirellulaceae bacterium]|nr:PIN domain-containing protein [Pirellulaceae bacterium]